MKNIQIVESVKDKEAFCSADCGYLGLDEKGLEMQLIELYPFITYQEIKGFGGAFTPAAASVYASMEEAQKKEVMRLLFSPDGLSYSCGRVAIASCDFSEGNYSYCEEEDSTLESFTVAHDEIEILPMLRDAQASCTKMEWMASPWSPPSWMKTNGRMCSGGSLKADCFQTMADYMVKFVQEYEKAGIHIGYLTVQNEPHAVQKWESCIYTAEQEQMFIRDHLAAALHKASLEHVKIVIWDHNKENVYMRARQICADEKASQYISGIAFHWYSGDHFENLALCHEFYPDKELIFTEGCVEITDAGTVMAAKAGASEKEMQAGKSPWAFGECYGHDIMGNLNHGMNRFIDWNVLLDEQGGPNHVGNYCSAPLIYDRGKKEVLTQPSYLFISHFSRFIKNGYKRIACSRYTDKLEVTSFRSDQGKIVTVILNTTGEEIPFALKDIESNEVLEAVSKGHSIMTICYWNL